MTSMKFSSLGGFAAHLLTIEADLQLTREVCVEKACRMVEMLPQISNSAEVNAFEAASGSVSV
jgi:hypothetical protein